MTKTSLPKPLIGQDGQEVAESEEVSELQQMELFNMDLQAQIIQQSGDNAKLKIKERELAAENEELRLRLVAMERGESAPSSRYHSNNSVASRTMYGDQTELEVCFKTVVERRMGRILTPGHFVQETDISPAQVPNGSAFSDV